jgi:hypothetical protein
MDVAKYSKTFSTVKGPFAWEGMSSSLAEAKRANLYPFVPDEEAMRVVVWRVEVIYIHLRVVGVESQRIG